MSGSDMCFSTILDILVVFSYHVIAVAKGRPETSLYTPEGKPCPGPPSMK
jgi:hypothetical protein